MDYCDVPPIRRLFYIFNFVFAASGIGLTIVGAVVTSRLSSSTASSFLPLAVLAPPAFIIALGALSLLCVAFSVTLCRKSDVSRSPVSGRLKKTVELSSVKKGRAALYAAIVSVVAFAELVTGSVSLSARKHYNRALREAMEDSLYIYPNDSYARRQWDVMQQKLMCCGVFNPGEWLSHPLMTQLPPSCCEPEPTPPPIIPQADLSLPLPSSIPLIPLSAPLYPTCSFLWGHDVFHSGCFRKIRKVVDSATVTIGGVSVAVGVVKILLAIFGLLLSRAAVKRYMRV